MSTTIHVVIWCDRCQRTLHTGPTNHRAIADATRHDCEGDEIRRTDDLARATGATPADIERERDHAIRALNAAESPEGTVYRQEMSVPTSWVLWLTHLASRYLNGHLTEKGPPR